MTGPVRNSAHVVPFTMEFVQNVKLVTMAIHASRNAALPASKTIMATSTVTKAQGSAHMAAKVVTMVTTAARSAVATAM